MPSVLPSPTSLPRDPSHGCYAKQLLDDVALANTSLSLVVSTPRSAAERPRLLPSALGVGITLLVHLTERGENQKRASALISGVEWHSGTRTSYERSKTRG